MENKESYQVVVKNIKNLLTSLKIKEFSLLDIYADNNYLLGDLISGFNKKLKDLIIIGNADADFSGNKKILSEEEWEIDTLKIAEKFKNAVVIFNKIKFNEKSFVDNFATFKQYFPVIFVNHNENIKTDIEGWVYKKLDEGVGLFLNKNVKKFKSFLVDNFDEIKTIGINAENNKDYQYSRDAEEIDIVLEEEVTPPITRRKPNDIDLTLFSSLPYPSIKPDLNSKTYIQEFYSYLKSLFTVLLPPGKEKLIPYLLNKDTLKTIWIPTFTHQLIKPNDGENYETFETLGDLLMSHVLISYYLERNPGATPKELTNVKSQMLKTERQGEIGKAMRLNSWAFVVDNIRGDLKLSEDLVEAFFGALDTVMNKISTNRGQSINIVYYFYKKLFDDYEFVGELKGADKNFIEQMIPQIKNASTKAVVEESIQAKKPDKVPIEIWDEMLSFGNKMLEKEGINTPLSIHGKEENRGFELKIFKKEGKTIHKVIVNDFGSKVFASRGINIKPGTVIGESSEATKRPGANVAYEKAREYLNKKGVDENWRDLIKIKKLEETIDDLYLALAKAKKHNPEIKYISVDKTKALTKHHFYQVFGLDKNMRKYVLYTLVSDDQKRNNFQLAIDCYLKQKA